MLLDTMAKYHFRDKEIGRFLKELSNAGLTDRTIVAVTSDHGESLGENDHYFAHGHNVTHELVDVPLMLHGKNINAQMCQHRVSLIDLPSTLLNLSGIEKPNSFRGTDLFETQEQQEFYFPNNLINVGRHSRGTMKRSTNGQANSNDLQAGTMVKRS